MAANAAGAGNPRHISIPGSTWAEPSVHHRLCPRSAAAAMCGASAAAPSTWSSGSRAPAGPDTPANGASLSGSMACSSPSNRSSAKWFSSDDSASASICANHGPPLATQSSTAAPPGAPEASVSGKCRPTRSTLGISTPAQALPSHTPGASAKRQIGLVR
jgi:hypothetical protein